MWNEYKTWGRSMASGLTVMSYAFLGRKGFGIRTLFSTWGWHQGVWARVKQGRGKGTVSCLDQRLTRVESPRVIKTTSFVHGFLKEKRFLFSYLQLQPAMALLFSLSHFLQQCRLHSLFGPFCSPGWEGTQHQPARRRNLSWPRGISRSDTLPSTAPGPRRAPTHGHGKTWPRVKQAEENERASKFVNLNTIHPRHRDGVQTAPSHATCGELRNWPWA